MKLFMLTALLLLSTPLLALDKCMSGSWYDPENSGEGITLQVLGDTTLGYFYTFGSAGKAWYVMLGEDTSMTMIGTVKTGEVITEAEVGYAEITVIDNNNIIFDYNLNLDVDDGFDWCLSGFCSGNYAYKRITSPIPCE